MLHTLEGLWKAFLDNGTEYPILLPGTLDENRIGEKDVKAAKWHPDVELGNQQAEDGTDAVITNRFTRNYIYEGAVRLEKRINFLPPQGKRVFLEAERARCLKLLVDGKEVPDFLPPSISTPHIFEVTGLLGGDNLLTLISDNSYPGLPHDAIVFSSAATNETQTNWNGILGYLRLRIEEAVFLSQIRVYPKGEGLTVELEVSASVPYEGTIVISSEALNADVVKEIKISRGISKITLENLLLAEGIKRWDEYEGNLYQLKISMTEAEEKTVFFGVRTFGDDGTGRLALNGRTIFLRSEANCAVFPEEGHPPMTEEAWTEILNCYKSYGVNCMRFHSWCPPEAAFTAADSLGMMMQPELSHWNPKDALESEESFRYYEGELTRILRVLANHPSFVMLTLGNELWSDEMGHQRMAWLVNSARQQDNTRLYANGSNVHYGTAGCDKNSDFYTSFKWYDRELRGTFSGCKEEGGKITGYINCKYPSAMECYDKSMEELRKEYKKPVFSFEVGQFEILPDFDELEEFKGISKPDNLLVIQKRVEERGLTSVWKRYVEATGELSLIGYREEVESAMRTAQLSGISLLGIQDFPGQGTALVGMLNSHMKPKPFRFAKPEAFRSFFTSALPLVCLPKYTFQTTEILRAEVKMSNFGKTQLQSPVCYELKGEGFLAKGQLPERVCPAGTLTSLGSLEIPLGEKKTAARLTLTVSVGDAVNTYPVWVYPPVQPVCPDSVYETKHLDEKAREILMEGGSVYLSPDSTGETLPESIQAQFTTDFWSVGTFPSQEGGMGQLIDSTHPVFSGFPTEFHTNWQWWLMAVQRAVILPRPYEAIITEMDSCAYLRYMAQLLECRCGNGKLLFSTMGLQNLQQFPEARALLASIYDYMDSEKFLPGQEIEIDILSSLVK